MENIIARVQKHFAEGVLQQNASLNALREASKNTPTFWVWEASDWMEQHYEVPLMITIVYVLFVFFGRKFMEKREAFKLQGPLALWNFGLAVFSIVGAYYTVPAFFKEWVFGRGLLWEMCHGDVEISSEWSLYFCLSKIPELLDTVFIVLRKKPLRFLQYYHHIVTMWFCWAAWAQKLECGGMYVVMNLVVHSFMYSYYMCSALHIYWPNWARKCITMAQLSQMVFGIIFVIVPLVFCPSSLYLLFAGLVMYITYFLLFAHLFYEMYLLPKSKAAATKQVSPQKKEQ